MVACDIERALVRSGGMFDFRNWLVVPRASWGVGLHECDLLALTKAGYAHEVEIKVTVSDLKRDLEKRHGHRSAWIKCLWFAMPEAMEGAVEYVPENAGVILVEVEKRNLLRFHRARVLRKPRPRKDAVKWGPERRFDLARLGAIRYWDIVLTQPHEHFSEGPLFF